MSCRRIEFPHVETVGESWTSYAAAAYPGPEGLPRFQRRELRRAFYMGAWAMMSSMAAASAWDKPEGLAAMNRLHDEIEAFAALVREGRD